MRLVGTRSRLRGAGRLWPLPCLLVLLLATACQAGQYPNDVFPEMHYSPAQRPLEPVRQAPPPDSVPVTGRAPEVTFAQARTLSNPYASDQTLRGHGAQVFGDECAMCHGANGRGDSVVAAIFRANGDVPPVNFTSARTRSRTPGELYWIVRYGLGNMPAFKRRLSDRDIWAVVSFVQQLRGGG